MHIKRIHEMVEKLTEVALCEINKGIECVDTEEFGEVVDTIKDLCEAEKSALIAKEMKKCEEEDEAEEKYMLKMLKEEYKDEYKRMREEYGEDEGEKRFYDNYRYKSSGRFAPKGSGSYMPRRGGRRRGYEEMPYMHMYPEMYDGMTPEEMRDMDLDKNRMYYTPAGGSYGAKSGGSSRGGASGSMSGNIRGYEDGYSDGQTRGYSDGYRDGERSGRGKGSNSRYDNARRGYSESKEMHKGNSKEDNEENLRNLEKILAVIDEDVKELMPNMSPSEKTMLKAKFSTWAQKVS